MLVIRGFLAATGYPQIGGDGLHIAHMLWGGLFMMLALLMLFSLMGIVVLRLSAILAGVGFGTFIDELGKFITSDNDYFFQPTVGIIYIIFIGIFLLTRTLRQNRQLTPQESLSNIFNRLIGSAERGLDTRSKREVTELLTGLDPANPLVHTLGSYVDGLETPQNGNMRFYFRLRDSLANGYSRFVLNRFFTSTLTGLFVFIGIVQIIEAVVILIVARALEVPEEQSTFIGVAQVGSSSAASAMILYGAWLLRRSRARAYRWFMRAILVNIFVTQVFAFFESELAAIGGLFFSILIYIALRLMIQREEEMNGAEPQKTELDRPPREARI